MARKSSKMCVHEPKHINTQEDSKKQWGANYARRYAPIPFKQSRSDRPQIEMVF